MVPFLCGADGAVSNVNKKERFAFLYNHPDLAF